MTVGLGWAARALGVSGMLGVAAMLGAPGLWPSVAPTPVGVALAADAPAAAGDAAAIASVEAAKARLAKADYERAVWDPIHFKPAIDVAKDAACLTCHQEIMSAKPRDASPAGVKATSVLAWYQTLDTYAGAQQTFHWRHIQSPFAKQVMQLSCAFCHQGNDPRERSPHVTATTAAGAPVSDWPRGEPAFTLRKTVNPSETCLRCHGSYPAENMGLAGSWAELREGLETPETPNGCLTCHADQFRTVRHQVTYLKAAEIEKAAKTSSDVCYGCHGGRQWYRISYPYPRHPWPGMPADAPEWAAGRPVTSDARFALPQK
ncbi:hypothetical protein NK718_13700 [Alsobacter sp. SYSU M60028]|uniref:Doubled CXXCH motif domain-containing protein n=1 Tax=Alsobacter ponti TaxID=2962936 RepID=A0ABT1LF40_9HYPH|nr:hypothetical protein [Alsobacter ponti]MCP8939576.1 hypothetical protein [Alsobacter ponti]